ncbi:MAG TPA: oligogalacturonate lyase family protein [Bryobacteraceae bacterium]|nr:oligogalacturonate lyase family protein [Bryobacteraceae bacterium]
MTGPEFYRYADPATELEVVRLTSPAFTSGLAATHLRQFTKHSDALIYWSERDGTRQLYRLDLAVGESKQLTSASALDTVNFSLSPDDRYLYYFDGPALVSISSSALKPKELYRIPNDARTGGISVASDGSVLFAEGSRIRRVGLKKNGPVLDADGPIDLVMARPHRTEIAWRSNGDLWLANEDGRGRRRISLEAGTVEHAVWAPSGKTLLYLHLPDDPKQLITLREASPEDGTDKQLARTSQYATFAPNTDASVFAGASRSKASSYILILLRVTRRELALCEHHASDPSLVSVVFAPDSRNIVFVSDRHGKPALYRVPVQRFVEETDDQ